MASERREGWIHPGSNIVTEDNQDDPMAYLVREVLPGDEQSGQFFYDELKERHARLVAAAADVVRAYGKITGFEMFERVEALRAELEQS